MTEVRIPVSADVQGGLSSIDRLVTALRKAGQEGKRFSDIDWNLPDLKKFAADAKHMQDRFQDISSGRVRGATAQAVRAGKYPDFVSWAAGNSSQFTTARARENHQNNVMRYIGAGTQFGPGAGGSGGGAGGGSPFPVGGMLKGVAAMAGIGGVMAMAGKGISSASSEATSLDQLLRSVDDTSHSFDRFRTLVRQAGDNLQLSNEETMRLTAQFAKLSNSATVAGAAGDTRNAVGFARSFGLSEDSTTAKFAQAKFLGATDQKQFAVMIADAVSSGKMWGKTDEVLSSVVQWMQNSVSIMARTPNVPMYLDMQARMNASKVPGLMGGPGAALLGQLDQGIRHPGMGEAGSTFMWKALSQGKPLNPFEFKYRSEGGAFGGQKGGPTNIQLVMDAMNQQYGPGNGREKQSALSNVFQGTSMRQWEELLRMGSGRAGKLGAYLGKLGLTDVNPTALKDMGQISGADAGGLEQWRKDLLGRKDITDDQKSALTGKTGEELRDAMMRLSAATGRAPNEATEMTQSIKDLSSMLSTTLANMIEPLTAIRNVVVKIGDFLLPGGEKEKAPRGAYGTLGIPDLGTFPDFQFRGAADTAKVDVKIHLMDEDGTTRKRKDMSMVGTINRSGGVSKPVNTPRQ